MKQKEIIKLGDVHNYIINHTGMILKNCFYVSMITPREGYFISVLQLSNKWRFKMNNSLKIHVFKCIKRPFRHN